MVDGMPYRGREAVRLIPLAAVVASGQADGDNALISVSGFPPHRGRVNAHRAHGAKDRDASAIAGSAREVHDALFPLDPEILLFLGDGH